MTHIYIFFPCGCPYKKTPWIAKTKQSRCKRPRTCTFIDIVGVARYGVEALTHQLGRNI